MLTLRIFRFFCPVFSAFLAGLLSSSTGFADYLVTYGSPTSPGRVYDSVSNTTTFTYTVTGFGDPNLTGRLKWFTIEVPDCAPALSITSVSPSFPGWSFGPPDWPAQNPIIYTGSVDPIFALTGVEWFGWHGNGTPPVLLTLGQTREFTISVSGNIEEGLSRYGTRFRNFVTNAWIEKIGVIPGPSCETACTNRVELNFNSLSTGTILSTQYLTSAGVTISAMSNNVSGPNQAVVFNSANPPSGQEDLGTPNSYYGGNGSPNLNFATGAGLGNYFLGQQALAILSPFSPTQAETMGGKVSFEFSAPTQVIGMRLVDSDEAGGSITGFDGANSVVFSEGIAQTGNNALQSIVVSHLGGEVTRRLEVQLPGTALIDNLVYCQTVPMPSPTPSPSASVSPNASPSPSSSPGITPSVSPSPGSSPGISPSPSSSPPGNSTSPSSSPSPEASVAVSPSTSPTAPPPAQSPLPSTQPTAEASPTPAIDCTDIDISESQFTLDGNTNKLLALIRKAAKALKQVATSPQDKAFASEAIANGTLLHQESWTLIWSLPSIVTNCTSIPETCVTTDNSEPIAGFVSGSNNLRRLVNRLVKRGLKVGGPSKKLLKLRRLGRKLHQQNLGIEEDIPKQGVSCTE